MSWSKPLAGQALAFLQRCRTACVLKAKQDGKHILYVEEKCSWVMKLCAGCGLDCSLDSELV